MPPPPRWGRAIPFLHHHLAGGHVGDRSYLAYVGGMVQSTPRSAQVPVRRDASSRVDDTAPVIDHLLYLPEGYARQDRNWPLVLFLHGSGERGADLRLVGKSGPPGLVAHGRTFPFVLVSPQCPVGQQWVPETLLRLIDQVAAEYRVDPDRVYVTGFSMGGSGTWKLAGAAPDRFAAIAPLAGGEYVIQADRLAGLPIWAFHGAVDPVVPMQASRDMIDAVRAAGGDPKLTVYENEGHGIDAMTYSNAEFWSWLLAQHRGRSVDTARE